jgi:hypothetical protein
MTSAAPTGAFSTEFRVAVAPDATFRQLRASQATAPGWRLLRRPAMVILVIAVLAPIMAVQRVTIGLVATAAVSWCFVVGIQTIVALCVIASAPTSRVRMAQAIDLWFAGHLPYSLWMLVAFTWMGAAMSGPLRLLIASAIVPAAWTAFIVATFCRTVLDTSASGARWRSAAHFVGVWTIALTYIAWAAGGWFQLLPP